MIKYFESIEKAKEFAKENHITNYVFYTPDFMERGVDMAWESKDGNKL